MRLLASNVLRPVWSAAVVLALAMPARAALPPATVSLYTQRLADNAAARYGGLAGSPLVGVASVPVLDDVVVWDRLRREDYRGSFAEYARFLKDHGDWPQAALIRRQAEKAIDDTIGAPERLAFFKQFPPQSAAAKLRLAEAQLTMGRAGEARETARDAWDSAGLTAEEEVRLLGLFERDLRPDDHLGRADRLLWSGQTTAATRLLGRLDMDRRLWLLARVALRVNSPDAVNRLAGVPASLRGDPGLLLDRALWLRRTGDIAGARALLAATNIAPGTALDADAWLRTRLDFARAAWRDGQFDTAYRIAANHNAFALGRGLSDRPLGQRQLFVDTEWLAGWLALRKLGNPARAVNHFQNVRTAALTPLSQTRGDYWTGRAAEAAGRQGEARAAYEAAASHPDYFYGQLAHERLGRPLALPRIAAPAVSANAASSFRADSLVRAATALGDLGDRGRQTLFLRALAERADGAEAGALLASLSKQLGRPDLGVMAGKAARSDGELAQLDTSFPMLPLPASLDGQWTMIHAITRQESQFDRGIVSPANAKGLMQLLPSTAAEQAGKLGLPSSTERLTSDPVYNVTLGSAYYARLRDNFAGSHVLAVAGYNAGPGNVRKFLAQNGDPRTGVDVIDWIEAIPLSETRNYVQRVLENAVVYDLLHPATATMPASNRLSAYLGKRTPG